MPSRRQSSAMLSAPFRPSRTTLIFSSAEYCLRVARRMSLTTFSPGAPTCAGYLSHLQSLVVTMGQKPSLIKLIKST